MPIPTVLTAKFLVSTNPNAEGEPAVAAGLDGRFAIHWQAVVFAEQDIYGYLYQATPGASGTGSIAGFSPFGAFATDVEGSPDMAFLTNGTVVSTFEKVVGGNSDIYMQLHTKNANGTYASGAVTLVNTGATAGAQYNPEVARLVGGGFVVAWADAGDFTIQINRYDSAGIQQGAALTGSVSGFLFNDSIGLTGLANGGFAVAYPNGTGGGQGVKLSIYDASGVPVATAIDMDSSGTHSRAALTQLPNGNIAVVWRDSDAGDRVGYRIFNSGGGAVTGPLLLDSVGSANAPRVAATLDGRFMVVWSGLSGATTIYGQMVNANGTTDGAAFIVDTAPSGLAQDADIATLADGRILVTWFSAETGAGDTYAKVYDPRETGVVIQGTSGVDNYIGTAFADIFFGTPGADTYVGGAGIDLVTYAASAQGVNVNMFTGFNTGGDALGDVFSSIDNIIGSSQNDTIIGSSNPNVLTGGGGADNLFGGDGADTLDGGTGADIMQGGFAGDLYFVDNSGDQVIELLNEGYDVVIATANFTLSGATEQLVLQGAATIGTGDAQDNYLYGGNSGFSLNLSGAGGDDVIYSGLAGGNTLSGGSGTDTLLIYGGNNNANGGFGNDIYYTYTATDQLSEAGGDGIDTVFANWNITLGAGFEQLVLFGAANTAVGSADNNIIYGNGTSGAVNIFGLDGADVLYGGALNDTLSGGAGNDYLFGLVGANLLIGGADSDIYYVINGGNTIIENAGEGFDTLYSNVDVTLAENVEQLILYGAAAQATGSSGNDYIYANSATVGVVIDGGAGFDYLLGSGFADTLIGGLGNDQFDLNTGGNDTIRYLVAGNMGGDFVYSFDADPAGGQDVININGMGYSAASIGNTIIIGAAGADTLVTFQGATSLAGTVIRLLGVNSINVTATDFVF